MRFGLYHFCGNVSGINVFLLLLINVDEGDASVRDFFVCYLSPTGIGNE